LFSHADEGDVEFVRAVRIGGAEEIGSAEHESGACACHGLREEVPAAEMRSGRIHALTIS
jgi:hypothetical protein